MKSLITIVLLMLAGLSFGQQPIPGESVSFRYYKKEHSSKSVSFAVKGDKEALMREESVLYKSTLGDWHYIVCTSDVISDLLSRGIITQIYFEPPRAQVLNDTMTIVQNIDSVHMGEAPLIRSFTGKDVIIGYIDTGVDLDHGDFQNPDGSTRVLYYWDHTLPFDAQMTPGKYGYGQVWDSTSINAGLCTSTDNNAHGTTVTGAGSGNGNATGTYTGVAPDSDIIIVESNFGLPNWTLTIADAVDFIFSMADTLGKPAVVNLSLGDYLGSHDGLDPAGQYIDSLVNDMPGRIVVAAAGNSGAQGKYHVDAAVDADTSFCWFEVNPSTFLSQPGIIFDLWSDTADFKDVIFSFGADTPGPNHDFRGRTQYFKIDTLLGVVTQDSIMVGPNKLAPIEFYCEEMNGVYHVEAYIINPDSSTYLYRFETHGDGHYDLWSGAWLGLSNIKSTGLPSVGDFPPIAYYNPPDTLSTIVSSWNCSPSTVSVGNFTNRKMYIDFNSNPYYGVYPPGQLSVNSSKGPNRQGYIKPDVSASGDLVMAACPLWLQASLQGSNPAMLTEDGQHVRNGGTSMASPVIAGIAALYLEKCPNSTYQDFIDDLHAYTYEDSWTGATPNMAYGYGKVNAFYMLNQTNVDVTLLGDTLICADPEVYETAENNFSTYDWYNGQTSANISLFQSDTVFLSVTNDKGCEGRSDTLIVIKGEMPTDPVINQIGGGLITTPADSFAWYFEGTLLSNSDAQYFNPDTSGYFYVEVFGPEGCSLVSDSFYVDLSNIIELGKSEFIILPNPFEENFKIIKGDYEDLDIILTDVSGKVVYQAYNVPGQQQFIEVNVPNLPAGTYFLTLYYDQGFDSFKLIRQ